jgi:hypothetical protein
LQCAGPIENVDHGLGPILDGADVLRRHDARLPSVEQLPELGVSSLKVVSPTNDERRIIGLEPGGVELNEILARELGDAGLRAGPRERVAIGVPRPIQQARKYAQGHGNRGNLLTLNRSDPLFLQTAEIGLRKGRMEDQIGVQFEGAVQVALQRGGR